MSISADELMRLAIEQARLALELDEVPIGCVIRHDPTDRIIGRGFNRRETDHDPTAHAEIIAINGRSYRLQKSAEVRTARKQKSTPPKGQECD